MKPTRRVPRLSGDRRFGATAALAGCLALTLGLGCDQPAPEQLNLLLITVDTLRPDRLGSGGHRRDTSPAIDRLAASGVVYRRAYSQAGWTLPSVATILTGRYPKEHGAVTSGSRLDATVPTLAELLASAGYDTRALVSHVLLRPSYGLGRGFARYDASVLRIGSPDQVASAEPLTDLTISALARLEQPFFVWVHYFDPHSSYIVHPIWTRYGRRPIDRYDGEIAHTDHHIGRLLDALADRDLDHRTVVVLTADHGEEFGEHDGKFHYGVEQEVLRIPLIVRAPGLEAGVEVTVAQQIDLLPTALALLGLEPPDDLPGRDLMRHRGEAGGARPVFVERYSPTPFIQRAVIRGRYKLLVVDLAPDPAYPDEEVESRSRKSGVRPGIYLFDLEADPGETTNLYHEDLPVAAELARLLDEHHPTNPDAIEQGAIDDELRRQLESLGYLQ